MYMLYIYYICAKWNWFSRRRNTLYILFVVLSFSYIIKSFWSEYLDSIKAMLDLRLSFSSFMILLAISHLLLCWCTFPNTISVGSCMMFWKMHSILSYHSVLSAYYIISSKCRSLMSNQTKITNWKLQNRFFLLEIMKSATFLTPTSTDLSGIQFSTLEVLESLIPKDQKNTKH